MSRLDDELRAAFRRQEPSEDFAARVLAQLNAQPKPAVKQGFWQTLVSVFQPNALRWAMATAALLLVAVLGFVQYQRQSQRAPSTGDGVQAQTPPPVMANPPGNEIAKDPSPQDEEKIGPEKKQPHEPKRLTPRIQPVTRHRPATGSNETLAHEKGAKPEGEIAKEQLMKALYIASTLINEAKDVAIGGKD